MITEGKPYNNSIDFLKGIACVFVVFMHCEFPGVTGIAVQAISRFCVPFFFMVSGYFCFSPHAQVVNTQSSENQTRWKRIKKKVLHIGKITLYASLFYLAFILLQHLVFHNQNFIITKSDIFNWVVFNAPKVIASQYWFLFALLYAYLFYGILERFHLLRFSYILAGILFVVYICLAQGAHLIGYKIPNMMYRNWLVEAFPYFMLGHWIHENQDKIALSNKTLISIIVVTTLLCWVERWIMGRDFGVNIVTIPQVFALFVYGVKNPTRHEGVIQKLGRDCSMLIYILHPAIWRSIIIVYQRMGLSENLAALYIMPILVLGLSIIAALMVNAIVAGFKTNLIARNTNRQGEIKKI